MAPSSIKPSSAVKITKRRVSRALVYGHNVLRGVLLGACIAVAVAVTGLDYTTQLFVYTLLVMLGVMVLQEYLSFPTEDGVVVQGHDSFDVMTGRFTETVSFAAGWKQNYFGASYSTRVRAAICALKLAILEAEAHPEIGFVEPTILAGDGDHFDV